MMADYQDAKRERLMTAILHGVHAALSDGSREADAIRLRVGLTEVALAHGALVDLLVRKGIITREEYSDEVLRCLEAEIREYEKRTGMELL